LLGGWVAFWVEAPSRVPQILQHVDQIHHDRQFYLAAPGLELDTVDLVVVAVL
jgi:hypothetical protein